MARVGWRHGLAAPSVVGLLCIVLACGTLVGRDPWQRSLRHFNRGRYDRAHALLQGMEEQSVRPVDLDAAYSYLRGMTEYRLDHRREAIYWLSLAEVLRQRPAQRGAAEFRPEWAQRLQATRRALSTGDVPLGADSLQVIQVPGASGPVPP